MSRNLHMLLEIKRIYEAQEVSGRKIEGIEGRGVFNLNNVSRKFWNSPGCNMTSNNMILTFSVLSMYASCRYSKFPADILSETCFPTFHSFTPRFFSVLSKTFSPITLRNEKQFHARQEHKFEVKAHKLLQIETFSCTSE